MLFKPIFPLVVLATIVNSRTLTLEELLKRASNSIDDPNDVPVTKVKEATGQAESNKGTSVDQDVPQTRGLADPAADDVVEQVVISGQLKDIIVSLHNELRANVKPPATDMQQMSWDNNIAKYAADWATCGDNFFHHRRGVNKVEKYGENLYISMSSATGAPDLKEDIKNGLMAWWNEKEHFNLAGNSCKSGKVCGHYTQMAWAKSNKIGCGYALNCPVGNYSRSFYLVCNYSPPGNYIGQKPYAAKASTGPAISTFGGTANGAKCFFPFEYQGESHSKCFEVYPGEMPWCKTENGKWGYCAPEGTESTRPCKDTVSYCAYYKRVMKGKCPTDTHWSNYKRYMERRCSATCGYCKYSAIVECQNGGNLVGSSCRCKGAWIGGDCRVCLLKECKNGGTLDPASCSCKCPEGFGGADCGCVNNPDPFKNHDYTFTCAYKGIKTNSLCRCPHWGPVLKQECPTTCGTCPKIGMDDRE